jgi:hypothetical protein
VRTAGRNTEVQHRTPTMRSKRMRVRAIARNNQPYNNGLHQTGRGGVAFASRRRPVVEARPAGEPECWTGVEDSEWA